jgi:mannose-6-phosphate isomerase-like protein (cupin superfamily)
MKVQASAPPKAIERFGSHRASILPILHAPNRFHIALLRLEPKGLVGMHPTSTDQVLAVVEGSGTVRTPNERLSVQRGSVVTWSRGEQHETTAGIEGLTALIVEGEGLEATLVR